MASIKGIPLSKVSPAFLHANSTSHTWAFSAFAELIDNAYDPDVSASELLIDKVDIRGVPCLIFLDNGAGMDREQLLKMLSFGFCEKDIYERQGSHQPIGHYGNGFKSGSMRIGLDALVFTRCQKSASIGFLSQSYLKSVQADSVMVPILEYRLPHLERIKSQESRNNLNAILEYSVFKLEDELKEELKALEGSKTGTKIIIYHLKRLQDNTYELDFSSDPTDIRCPEAHEADMTSVYHRPIQHNTSEYKRSLREYCSILFLRPRMKITIRGVRVKSKLISKSLSNTEIDMYKPTWLSRPVKIIFGFTCETPRPEDCDYGMMLYHRNRLIKAFEKIGYQKQPNGLGVGVVGVAQVDFLQPIHNKQDFNKDEKFNSVMSAFAQKLNDYWNEKKGSANQSPAPAVRNFPDWLWAQCDHCLKWRRLPDEIDRDSLPAQWYCRMNPDATHNRCDIPEEPEDEDLAVKPTYEKTFKRKQEERKRQQQIEREKEEDIKRRKIMEKERELKQKEATLRAIQQVAAAQPMQETRTVVSLQKALAESRKREEHQKRLLLQIQVQKKLIEEQRNSLLMVAENIQASKGKSNEELLDQISKILNTLNANSVSSTNSIPSSPTVSNKRPATEEPPNKTVKNGKKMCIKTEAGEMLSITENNVDDDGDVNTSQHTPAPSPRKQRNNPRQNAPAVTTETVKNSMTVSPLKQSQASPSAASGLRTPTPKSVRLTSLTDSTSSVAPSSSTMPNKTRRERRKKGAVVAVIDLTSDSEFGELVDVKPDLAELRIMLQESLQVDDDVDIKPDKDDLDKAISDKDDLKKEGEPGTHIAETKKEATEISSQASLPTSKKVSDMSYSHSSSSDTNKPNSSAEIQVHKSDDGSEAMGETLRSIDDNIEAAIAAIQARMEREKQNRSCVNGEHGSSINREHGSSINGEHSGSVNRECLGSNKMKEMIKDEIPDEIIKDKHNEKSVKRAAAHSSHDGASFVNSTRNTKEAGENIDESADESGDNTKNKGYTEVHSEKYLPSRDNDDDEIDNDFGFASDDDDDYRDHSAEDGRRETCEPLSVTKKFDDAPGSSRSNSLEEGAAGCDAPDADSPVGQGNAEIQDEGSILQPESHNKVIDTNGPSSVVCSEDKIVFESQERGEDNLMDCSAEEENSPGSLTEKIYPRTNHNQETEPAFVEIVHEKNSTVTDKTKTQSNSCVILKKGSTHQNDYKLSKNGQDRCENEESYKQSAIINEQLSTQPEVIELFQLGKCITVKQASPSKRVTHRKEHISEPASDNCETSEDPRNENDGKHNSEVDSVNNEVYDEVDCDEGDRFESESQRTFIKFKDKQLYARNTNVLCDQQVQTDLRMAALEDIFRKEGCSGHQDLSSKENLHINSTFQNLSQTSHAEAQTEERWSHSGSSVEDSEAMKDLRTKILLKNQLVEEAEARLQETQANIHKLLSIIVPGANLGEVGNIDQVVKDMIRSNEESSQTSIEDPSPPPKEDPPQTPTEDSSPPPTKDPSQPFTESINENT